MRPSGDGVTGRLHDAAMVIDERRRPVGRTERERADARTR